MSTDCPLLRLPAELREVILRHAFAWKSAIRVRSPCHRRLRPSRMSKDDPQGLLGTCHTLREESIPIFYQDTAVIFHSTSDAYEYLNDPQIDPFCKDNVTHLAIDEGDKLCQPELFQEHQYLLEYAWTFCKSLKAIELRTYCRQGCPITAPKVADLIANWRTLEGQVSDAPSQTYHSQYSLHVDKSTADYEPINPQTPTAPTAALICCNLIMSLQSLWPHVLGGAAEAVKCHKTRVGAIKQLSGFDTDTRCPDSLEGRYMKDLEHSIKMAREATDRSIARQDWSTYAVRMPATVAPSVLAQT